ncbi:DMT family transporter [Comamonadaceae bacterium OH2545_COT-014]|nr:DMT family transporter [Comamonadaceae bacterium OH2545_COT-014]
MPPKLTPATALLLTLPPLLWAGNAVVGRLLAPLVPPVTLNLLRWVLAALVLLPLGWQALRAPPARQAVRAAWRPLALMGLLGIGCYNALQYLALQTSTPLNVTLVAASTPIWMMVVGALFFGVRPTRRQGVAALFSVAGVLVVITRGQWQALAHWQPVPGDLFMLAAALCWAGYSWLLLRAAIAPALRGHWAAFLLAQILFGLGWSGLATAAEWGLGAAPGMHWGWPLAAGLAYVALGPAVAAYRCWGLGVQQAGPTVAAFFSNLTPLFTAVLSALLLGEPPRPYHALAFGLIVAGIALSARR